MQAYGRSIFADTFAARAADSDYSRHPRLQVASQYDIRAAGEALWALAAREGVRIDDLSEDQVIKTMLAQEKHWDDENELVSTEFEEYWDATDTLGFSSGLRQRMQEELSRSFLNGKKEEHVVVNNRDGIWLFTKSGLRAAFPEG